MSLRASILAGVALLLTGLVLDWVTGPEVASALFYLPAVSWMTWQGGRWLGLGTAVTSCAISLSVLFVQHAPYPNILIPCWNSLVRTTVFCLLSGLQSEVMGRKRAETQARQANKELQAQAGIMESILNSMGDGVVVADAEGRLLHMNPTARRTLRIPAADGDVVAWLESQENYPPDFVAGQASRENPLLRAVRGEAVDEAEMFLPQADSPEGVWLSVTGRPLRDAAGHTAGGVIVFTDISARKKLERQIAEASDREQRRIGEDLHDGLCQHLVSTAFAARRLAGKLSEQSPADAEEAVQIAELLGESIAQARAVAKGLYLVPLETGGLRSALEEFAMQVQARHQISCQFVEKVSVPVLGEAVITNLFRIVQEAVNNAVKHAQAGHIAVTLSADEEQIQLTVEDDGTGFRPDSGKTRGMGLHLMNYRARMMGAALRISPRPAGGTVISCSIRRDTLAEADSHVERD